MLNSKLSELCDTRLHHFNQMKGKMTAFEALFSSSLFQILFESELCCLFKLLVFRHYCLVVSLDGYLRYPDFKNQILSFFELALPL